MINSAYRKMGIDKIVCEINKENKSANDIKELNEYLIADFHRMVVLMTTYDNITPTGFRFITELNNEQHNLIRIYSEEIVLVCTQGRLQDLLNCPIINKYTVVNKLTEITKWDMTNFLGDYISSTNIIKGLNTMVYPTISIINDIIREGNTLLKMSYINGLKNNINIFDKNQRSLMYKCIDIDDKVIKFLIER